MERARRSREERRERRPRRRFLLILVLTASVAGVGAWLASRIESPESAVARFEAAWHARGTEGLRAFFAQGLQAGVGLATRRALARRGWLDERPRLKRKEHREWPEAALTSYAAKGTGTELRVGLTVVGRVWRLRGLDLPPLEVGAPIGPALRAFEAAWPDAADGKALFELFEDDARAKLEDELTQAFERRSWLRSRPRIEAPSVDESDDGKANAAWKLAGDELRVQFEWWATRWRVVYLRLPPE